MEGTELTPEEQAQFLEEAADLAGKNVESAEVEDDTDADNAESEDDAGEEESKAPESKTEKKIKKLLSQKNQEKKRAETLAEKVERLEKLNERNEFYSEYPEAKAHADKIDEVLESKPGFTREDALFYLQGRGEIKSGGSTGFVGRPATQLQAKDITKGSTADMEAYLKEHASEIF